jgi:hypothetical protein
MIQKQIFIQFKNNHLCIVQYVLIFRIDRKIYLILFQSIVMEKSMKNVQKVLLQANVIQNLKKNKTLHFII